MEDIVGQVGLIEASALVRLGEVRGSASEVIEGFVENATDAGAKNVWVVIERDGIIVTDDGHGMVPDMLPEDYEMIKLFKEEARSGKLTEKDDIRDLIPPTSPSRKSLRWLAEYAAFSPKRSAEGVKTRGRLGIGTLAFRQIANSAVWLTRPALELADEFWGENVPGKGVMPVFEFVPPTDEALRKYQMGYRIAQSKEELCDHNGRRIVSGTSVRLHQIRQGVNVVPALLTEYLSTRYGEDIRNELLNILVVDTTAADGAKGKGKEYRVQPPKYRGIQILKEKVYLGGVGSFEAELYWDSRGGRALRPELRHKNAAVNADLTRVPGLNISPLNTGRISGYVEFPDVAEDLAPWSLEKDMPLESQLRNEWVRQVKDLAARGANRVFEIEDRVRQRSIEDFAEALSTAAALAMNDDPIYRNLAFGPSVRRPRQGGTKPVVVEDRVLVTVLDEHNRGLSEITVELSQGKKVLKRGDTQKSGGFSFGKLPLGEYTVSVVVPVKMKAQGRPQANIKLTETQPGVRVTFHLITGLPEKPRDRQIRRRPHIWVEPFPDPDQPYSIENMENGWLRLNSEFLPLRQAQLAKDTELEGALGATLVALAITEYGLDGDRAFLFRNASRLVGSMLSQVREIRQSQRSAPADSKKVEAKTKKEKGHATIRRNRKASDKVPTTQ